MSHLDRRQVLRIFGAMAAAGAAGAASGCSTEPEMSRMEQPSGRTIRIGLVAAALGPYRSVGADITNGFRLYLDDHGGLLGRHAVDLRVEDEGATGASARAAVDALLQNGVLALAGVANPVSLTAIRDTIEKAKVPLVCANASPTTLTSAFYIWRASYVEGEAGLALAPYALRQGGQAYLLHDNSQTARDEVRQFQRALEDLGGAVVGEDVATGSFAARLRQADQAGPNVIFTSYAGGLAQQVLEAYRDARIPTPLIGPGTLTETVNLGRLTEARAPLPEQIYTAMPYAYNLDNEANRRFASSYHKTHGVAPSVYAMTAYDAASVIDKALRLIEGEPTPTALNTAFSLLGQIESPRGTWTFNRNRTPQQKWYLRRLRLDGQSPGNLLDTDLAVLS